MKTLPVPAGFIVELSILGYKHLLGAGGSDAKKKGRGLIFFNLLRGLEKKYHQLPGKNWVYMLFYGVNPYVLWQKGEPWFFFKKGGGGHGSWGRVFFFRRRRWRSFYFYFLFIYFLYSSDGWSLFVCLFVLVSLVGEVVFLFFFFFFFFYKLPFRHWISDSSG